jgi:hypothetical protein
LKNTEPEVLYGSEKMFKTPEPAVLYGSENVCSKTCNQKYFLY